MRTALKFICILKHEVVKQLLWKCCIRRIYPVPSVKVYYNWDNMFSVQLKEGSDYNVTYSDNINAGTATAIVTGIGAYSGTKNVTFTIEPKKISSPTFDGL